MLLTYTQLGVPSTCSACHPFPHSRPWTTFLPLAFVLGISLIKEAVEDYKRYRGDLEVNSRPTIVLNAATGQYDQRMWMDVCPGQIVLVHKDEAIPADLLLLCSSAPEGTCYVEVRLAVCFSMGLCLCLSQSGSPSGWACVLVNLARLFGQGSSSSFQGTIHGTRSVTMRSAGSCPAHTCSVPLLHIQRFLMGTCAGACTTMPRHGSSRTLHLLLLLQMPCLAVHYWQAPDTRQALIQSIFSMQALSSWLMPALPPVFPGLYP